MAFKTEGVVPWPVIGKAVQAVNMARTMQSELGADQFSTTFRAPDGSVGGRISWDDAAGEFNVDFSLYWNTPA